MIATGFVVLARFVPGESPELPWVGGDNRGWTIAGDQGRLSGERVESVGVQDEGAIDVRNEGADQLGGFTFGAHARAHCQHVHSLGRLSELPDRPGGQLPAAVTGQRY